MAGPAHSTEVGPALFTPYTQLKAWAPAPAWRALRWLGVACAGAVVVASWVNPVLGLQLFWGLFVPCLPLLFLVVPGLWRNVCPMAALNQLPRTLGFTRGLSLPLQIQEFAPLVSAGLFLLIVPLRKVVLEQDGPALAVFLATMLVLAFVGGIIFKGKSGWCSQFCPMLQVERFYGQSPLHVVRNSHCRPCVGCAVNCYDFNPTAAYLADLYDENPRLAANRRLFAGAMPWLIVAFFTQPALTDPSLLDIAVLYGRVLFFVAAGIGAFFAVEAITGISSQRLVLLHVVVAFNLFYFFVTPLGLQQLGLAPTPVAYLVQAAVGLLSAVWLHRVLPRERRFVAVLSAPAPEPRVADSVLQVHRAAQGQKVAVDFEPGPTAMATAGELLLVVAESNQVPIQSGCRMGMCGADPVRVLAGDENLSPITLTERWTLERLGLTSGCRMACITRVHGPVTITTTVSAVPAPESPAAVPGAPATVTPDPSVRRVVIIGAGVAGVTAALEVRKLNPECEVTLVGSEPYDFYNRMMIGKLVNESTSIENLYLMPRGWPDTKGVRFVRGVAATRIDRLDRRVITDDGDSLAYDRLILATGAESAMPEIEGFGIDGTFVLRTIDDAVAIQQQIRRRRCRTVLIIGGGLLGLEAAHYISQLGVRVFVLDRNEWPLSRQLDRAAGTLLAELMSDLGIDILLQAQARRITGTNRDIEVELVDGRSVAVDLCVAAIGIEPAVALARAAGLIVERGVAVDDRMGTSDPLILAAGDVVEHQRRIYGLWPASTQQARVAATNACGGDLRYKGTVPPAKLKVAAIDLLSVGDIDAVGVEGGEIHLEDPAARRYRKLVLQAGRVAGAILIGYPELSDSVTTAVESGRDVRAVLTSLELGEWSVLNT